MKEPPRDFHYDDDDDLESRRDCGAAFVTGLAVGALVMVPVWVLIFLAVAWLS